MEAIRHTGLTGPGFRRVFSGLGLCGAVLAVVLFGCREEVGVAVDRNRPPDTYLTGFPAESTTSFYRIHLFWYGNDQDGHVVGFEYAVTDSSPRDQDTITYHYTTRTDSIFLLQVGRTQQVLGHRFYIRAVDNEGKVDPEPAWTFFGSVDVLAPTPVFTRAEGFLAGTDSIMLIRSKNPTVPEDTVPAGWDVRFHWRGLDGDRTLLESGAIDTVGYVVAFEHWLTPVQAGPVRGGIGDTSSIFDNLQSGKYIFNLRAVDDAGFAGLDPTIRSFVWNKDPLTYFETGVNPVGARVPRFFATSNAWAGEREYFDGDTLPLTDLSGTIAPISMYATFWGRDPDDNLGRGVSGFQFRPGVGIWGPADTTVNPQRPRAALGNLSTGDVMIQARCTDAHGRRDGSPPELHFSVNRAPGLLDTLEVVGGVPVLQYPQTGQAIRLDELAAAGWVMRLGVKAADPDGTTRTFGYSFRAGGFLYSEPVQPPPGQICHYDFPVPLEWRQPGAYAIGVRIEELGYPRPHRMRDLNIPFRIVS